MMLYILRANMLTDKLETYREWMKKAIKRTLTVPGVIEFREYRTESSAQVMVTYKFEDMRSWSKWNSNKDIKVFLNEMEEYTSNFTAEIWILSKIWFLSPRFTDVPF